jgi:hypothetical protein
MDPGTGAKGGRIRHTTIPPDPRKRGGGEGRKDLTSPLPQVQGCPSDPDGGGAQAGYSGGRTRPLGSAPPPRPHRRRSPPRCCCSVDGGDGYGDDGGGGGGGEYGDAAADAVETPPPRSPG